MAIVLLGLRRFLEQYFHDVRAPALGLLLIYGLWGIPWVSTGLHNLRSVFYSAAYPSTLVFGIYLFTWTRSLGLSDSTLRWNDFLFFALTTCLSFICHQLSTAIGLIMTLLIIGFSCGFSNRKFAGVSLAVLSGLLLSSIWPYFDPISLVLSGGRDPINRGNSHFESLVPVLLLIGPALLGVLGLRRCLSEPRFRAIPAGFVVFGGLYLVGALLGNPVTHRLLPPAILCLHLGLLAWLTQRPFPDTSDDARAARFKPVLILNALLFAGQTGAVVLDISKVALNRIYYPDHWRFGIMPVVSEMTVVARNISQDAIVAADTTLSVSMPAFCGKLVASYRGINMIPDLQERRTDNSALLGDGSPLAKRLEIIKKYRVTHLLFISSDVSEQTRDTLLSLGERLTAPSGFDLVLLPDPKT